MTEEPEFVSVREVCQRYGWHKSTVHSKLRKKLIRGKRDGHKTMVNLQSVKDHVASLPDR